MDNKKERSGIMKADWKNTVIIVPIYNTEKYLPELFKRITKYFPLKSIFAVNDASEDNSKEICRKIGVKLIDLKVNSGKGNALQVGFKAAIEEGYKFAFTIDSDLQHKPEDFPDFIKKQNELDLALVIGKRDFSHKKMPFHRICSNTLTSWVVSRSSKQKILDSQCGFRLYNLEILEGMEFQTKRYQFETEIILKIAKKNGKVDFIPIETIYDRQVSYISGLRDIKNFIKIVLYEMKN
ncbi:MAG: glycosyltransferase family 2 protein [Candidatus Cloacimonetes bacterium]|nr:glycosyltransferase family 2 protein [Candidatus Cloacimonadota bacterium]